MKLTLKEVAASAAVEHLNRLAAIHHHSTVVYMLKYNGVIWTMSIYSKIEKGFELINERVFNEFSELMEYLESIANNYE